MNEQDINKKLNPDAQKKESAEEATGGAIQNAAEAVPGVVDVSESPGSLAGVADMMRKKNEEYGSDSDELDRMGDSDPV